MSYLVRHKDGSMSKSTSKSTYSAASSVSGSRRSSISTIKGNEIAIRAPSVSRGSRNAPAVSLIHPVGSQSPSVGSRGNRSAAPPQSYTPSTSRGSRRSSVSTIKGPDPSSSVHRNGSRRFSVADSNHQLESYSNTGRSSSRSQVNNQTLVSRPGSDMGLVVPSIRRGSSAGGYGQVRPGEDAARNAELDRRLAALDRRMERVEREVRRRPPYDPRCPICRGCCICIVIC